MSATVGTESIASILYNNILLLFFYHLKMLFLFYF